MRLAVRTQNCYHQYMHELHAWMHAFGPSAAAVSPKGLRIRPWHFNFVAQVQGLTFRTQRVR